MVVWMVDQKVVQLEKLLAERKVAHLGVWLVVMMAVRKVAHLGVWLVVMMAVRKVEHLVETKV